MLELSGDCTSVHSRAVTGVMDGASLESEPAIGLGLGCSSRGWWGPWWSILWVYWSAEAELLSPLTITHSLRTELLGRCLCPVIDRTPCLRHLSLSICEGNFSCLLTWLCLYPNPTQIYIHIQQIGFGRHLRSELEFSYFLICFFVLKQRSSGLWRYKR